MYQPTALETGANHRPHAGVLTGLFGRMGGIEPRDRVSFSDHTDDPLLDHLEHVEEWLRGTHAANDEKFHAGPALALVVNNSLRDLDVGLVHMEEEKLGRTVHNYAVGEIGKPSEDNPFAKAGGHDDADIDTKMGHIKRGNATQSGYAISEEKKQQRLMRTFNAVNRIYDDARRLADLEQRMTDLLKEIRELNDSLIAANEAEDLLDDHEDINTNLSKRNQLARRARAAGVDVEDYTDDNGDLDTERLREALRNKRNEHEERLEELEERRVHLQEQIDAERERQKDIAPSSQRALAQNEQDNRDAESLESDAPLAQAQEVQDLALMAGMTQDEAASLAECSNTDDLFAALDAMPDEPSPVLTADADAPAGTLQQETYDRAGSSLASTLFDEQEEQKKSLVPAFSLASSGEKVEQEAANDVSYAQRPGPQYQAPPAMAA